MLTHGLFYTRRPLSISLPAPRRRRARHPPRRRAFRPLLNVYDLHVLTATTIVLLPSSSSGNARRLPTRRPSLCRFLPRPSPPRCMQNRLCVTGECLFIGPWQKRAPLCPQQSTSDRRVTLLPASLWVTLALVPSIFPFSLMLPPRPREDGR